MSVETLLENVTPVVGEGPHWDDASQSLFFVEIQEGIIFRWDSNTGKLDTHKFGKNILQSPLQPYDNFSSKSENSFRRDVC